MDTELDDGRGRLRTVAAEDNHWRGVRRRDGLCIAQGIDGWIIIPAEGEAIDTCPCCQNRIAQAYYAKLIADRAYPLPAEASR
jgi:hypothetical protein